jgi:hypothetical protein
VEGAKETVRARRSHLRWPPVYLLTHGLSVRPSRLRSTDRASDAQTGIVTRAIFGPLLANQLAQPVCQRVCQSSIWRCSQCHGFCMTAHDTRAATCFATSLGKSWQLCPRALRWAYCFGRSVGKRIMRTAGQPPLLSSPRDRSSPMFRGTVSSVSSPESALERMRCGLLVWRFQS